MIYNITIYRAPSAPLACLDLTPLPFRSHLAVCYVVFSQHPGQLYILIKLGLDLLKRIYNLLLTTRVFGSSDSPRRCLLIPGPSSADPARIDKCTKNSALQ